MKRARKRRWRSMGFALVRDDGAHHTPGSADMKRAPGIAPWRSRFQRRIRSELVRRTHGERTADLRLEQRVLALAVDVQRVALVREVLRLEDHREVVVHV